MAESNAAARAVALARHQARESRCERCHSDVDRLFSADSHIRHGPGAWLAAKADKNNRRFIPDSAADRALPPSRPLTTAAYPRPSTVGYEAALEGTEPAGQQLRECARTPTGESTAAGRERDGGGAWRWLCEACVRAVSREDSGRWQLFCRLSCPLHAACACGDLNAARELWEGPGAWVLFERREMARDINAPADAAGAACDGWPPLAFACLPPSAGAGDGSIAWPPAYASLYHPLSDPGRQPPPGAGPRLSTRSCWPRPPRPCSPRTGSG